MRPATGLGVSMLHQSSTASRIRCRSMILQPARLVRPCPTLSPFPRGQSSSLPFLCEPFSLQSSWTRALSPSFLTVSLFSFTFRFFPLLYISLGNCELRGAADLEPSTPSKALRSHPPSRPSSPLCPTEPGLWMKELRTCTHNQRFLR